MKYRNISKFIKEYGTDITKSIILRKINNSYKLEAGEERFLRNPNYILENLDDKSPLKIESKEYEKIKEVLDKYNELQSLLQDIVASVSDMEGVDIRETLVQQLGDLTNALKQIVDTTNLKLLNYRQTSAVLTQEGVEMIEGSGMGCSCGCCLPLEFQPQYQNQMYY